VTDHCLDDRQRVLSRHDDALFSDLPLRPFEVQYAVRSRRLNISHCRRQIPRCCQHNFGSAPSHGTRYTWTARQRLSVGAHLKVLGNDACRQPSPYEPRRLISRPLTISSCRKEQAPVASVESSGVKSGCEDESHFTEPWFKSHDATL
jgi:hypothetical protein